MQLLKLLIILYFTWLITTKQSNFWKLRRKILTLSMPEVFYRAFFSGPSKVSGSDLMTYIYVIRCFPHRPHDIYICHRTYNILDLAVVQINFIFTVAVANRMFLEVIVSQSIVSFPQNVLLYKETMATSTEAKQHWY